MRCVLVLLFIASVAFAGTSDLHLSSWHQFKLTHNKVYNSQEERLRFQIFSENVKKIEEHNALYNAGLKTYKKAINLFADMTIEEFKNYLTLSGPVPNINGSLGVHQPNTNVQVPESIDYRKQGAVNAVKMQGSCGSCWAFSTVSSLESINFLKTGVLLSLSEQNLVDCNTVNHGCNGGWMGYAFDYIKDNGLESEADYPYIEAQDTCKFSPSKSVITVSGHKHVEPGSEEALKSAVGEVGPVSVTIDATEIMFYESGIFIAQNPSYQLNHAVVAVGYDSENGQDYWIVRNSWSERWGEQGYIKIARNYGNQIGIADQCVYPVL